METLSMFMLTAIQNGQEMHDCMIKSSKEQLDYVLLNPALILDPFLIVVAVNKALQSEDRKTKSIKTEIIYNLSHSSNISESLKVYGFNAAMKEAVLVSFLGDVPAHFNCRHEPLTKELLEKAANLETIKKVSIYY